MAILKSTLVNGDLTVTGSLNVQGELTYIGVENLRVKDKQIELNTDGKGSAIVSGQDASGAGIVFKGTTKDSSPEASILYNYPNDSLVINKTIKGTVSNATTAASADKVAQKLTVSVTDESGSVKKVEFDGSEAKTVNVNLQGLQNQINSLTGGAGSIKNQIDGAINALNSNVTATATGDAAEDGVFVLQSVEINESAGKLTSATPTAVKVEKAGAAAAVLGKAGDVSTVNTVFGVKAYAKEYVDGKVDGKFDAIGSAATAKTEAIAQANKYTNDEIKKLGLGTAAKSNVLTGTIANSSSDDLVTAAQVKTYADGLNTTMDGRVKNLEGKSHTHANKTELDLIAVGDKAKWDGHVANSDIHVTAEQKTAWSGKQDALANADVLAAITSTHVSNWDDAAAKAHEHTNKSVLDGITIEKVNAWDGAVEAAGVKSVGGKTGALTLKGGSETLGDVNLSISDTGEISAAIVSNSFDSFGSAATVKSEVIGTDETSTKDSNTIIGAKKYAADKVSALSSSVAATDTAQNGRLNTVEGDITNIKSSITGIQNSYVQKAGDTMTGKLIMNAADIEMSNNGTNGIIFGDMKIVWNNTDKAIEFIPTTA